MKLSTKYQSSKLIIKFWFYDPQSILQIVPNFTATLLVQVVLKVHLGLLLRYFYGLMSLKGAQDDAALQLCIKWVCRRPGGTPNLQQNNKLGVFMPKQSSIGAENPNFY